MRAVRAGAGCWAWIPGWETFGFHPQPPINLKHGFNNISLQVCDNMTFGKNANMTHSLGTSGTYKTELKLDKEVGGGVSRNVRIAND